MWQYFVPQRRGEPEKVALRRTLISPNDIVYKMKKTYIALIFSLFILISGKIQAQTARDYFLNMPASLLPYLTKVNKEDMPDFIESKMVAKVKNRFQSTTEMKQLAADFLEIETTSASTLQLKVLPGKNSESILALITTVQGPAEDSRVQFFTSDWTEIPASEFLTLPATDSFLLPVGTELAIDSTFWKEDSLSVLLGMSDQNPLSLLTSPVSEDLHRYLLARLGEVYLCSMSFAAGDNSLRLVLKTPEFLDELNRELARQCMRKEPLVLYWREGRFVEPG